MGVTVKEVWHNADGFLVHHRAVHHKETYSFVVFRSAPPSVEQ